MKDFFGRYAQIDKGKPWETVYGATATSLRIDNTAAMKEGDTVLVLRTGERFVITKVNERAGILHVRRGPQATPLRGRDDLLNVNR